MKPVMGKQEKHLQFAEIFHFFFWPFNASAALHLLSHFCFQLYFFFFRDACTQLLIQWNSHPALEI